MSIYRCGKIGTVISKHANILANRWPKFKGNLGAVIAALYLGELISWFIFRRHEIRIDCFVINLTPLRSDIESISRKYWETLANSLRISILNDISVLQDFLQTSLQVLQNVPFDEVGIAEAGAKYERIISELPKVI